MVINRIFYIYYFYIILPFISKLFLEPSFHWKPIFLNFSIKATLLLPITSKDFNPIPAGGGRVNLIPPVVFFYITQKGLV